MGDSLDFVKRRIVAKYLGKFGIHAVGVSRTARAICVYLDENAEAKPLFLKDLKLDAAPFEVLTFREERAKRSS